MVVKDVLIVTNMYPSKERPYSGIFVRDHARALEGLGVDVEVFAVNPKRSRLEYISKLPSLARSIKRRRPDLIHAQHTYCLHQLRLVRLAIPRRTPIVATFHEGEVGVQGSGYDKKDRLTRRLAYVKGLKRSALRVADHVVFVEESLAASVGYDGPCDVVPPALDTRLFRPMDRSEARNTLGLDADARIVFFPSDARRKAYNKGFDILEGALAESSLDVSLVTGGDIPHEKMPLFMNAADVVVQTSRFEASPMVLKEAMACGTPIVSTPVGDARWLLGSVPGHFISDPEPAAVAVRLRDAIAFGGRTSGPERLVELGLTLEAIGRRYVDLYEKLIGNVAATRGVAR